LKALTETRNTRTERVFLVGIELKSRKDWETSDSLKELAELATTAGGKVVGDGVQKLVSLNAATFIGRGKADEFSAQCKQLDVDTVIFDDELSPAQSRNLEKIFNCKVLDRTALILDIFAQRAQSREGKIQVELAQLKYMLPRLVIGQDSAFSRLAGGIGGRGPGETKLETDRRRVRDRINRLEKELAAQRGHRQQRRKERLRQHVPIISIVGYTNAGKSTLLNILTASHVVAEKRMFATLDPTTRRLRLPREREVIINDTVGFIRDLPPDLLAAFRSTIEEIADSSLLVHLVDASNPRWEQQIASVERTLTELNLAEIPRLLVFNKADLIESQTLEAMEREVRTRTGTDTLRISALDPSTLRALLDKIEAVTNGARVETRTSV
jgi:GTP-binding protein HflX